jgi:lipopolysaccharide transport system permease protein
MVDFGISLGVMLIIMFIYRYDFAINYNIFYLPVFVVLMMMFAAGIGMWLSALAIQYRDVKFAITFLITIMMYAAPVVYSAVDRVPGKYWAVYGLFPLAGILEGFRACLIGNPIQMPWVMILPGVLVTFVIFLTGAMYFRRMEKVFADVA